MPRSTFTLRLLLIAAALAGLYLTSLYSYLLFHTLAELISILLAGSMFILVWNFRPFFLDNFFQFIGVAHLFVAVLDVLHTLAYKGMNIFIGADANLPTQLWLAARFVQSLSLLIAPAFIGRRKPDIGWLILAYSLVTTGLVASIFGWKIFPDAFIEGSGLTRFKVASEAAIILMLAAAGLFLLLRRAGLERRTFSFLIAALLFAIVGELAFASYIQVTDAINLFGHLCKIVAAFLIYRAIVETGALRIYSDVQQLIETQTALRISEANERARVAEWEALLDAVPAVVWIANDPLCQSVTGNRFSYEMLRMPRGENQSLSAPPGEAPRHFRVFHDGREMQPHELPLQIAAREGIELHDYEEKLVFDDGESRTLYGNVTPLLNTDGSPRGAVAAFVDITEGQRAQEELERYAVQLEDANLRLEHANVALERSIRKLGVVNEALERSNNELEQFAFVASHDLQEPLRKVSAFTERLAQSLADRLDERERDYMQRTTGAARRMQTMIDGLLQYSRVSTHGLPFEPIDMDALIGGVISDLELAFERSGGSVKTGPIPAVNGDPQQIRRLFQNLIGNALKYHRPGVAPQVEISAISTNGDSPATVSIVVRDNGVGFDNAHNERIFRLFERLHGREIDGAGMGLAICHKIVERHGGSITAHGEPGAGATFTVTLPVDPQETPH